MVVVAKGRTLAEICHDRSSRRVSTCTAPFINASSPTETAAIADEHR